MLRNSEENGDDSGVFGWIVWKKYERKGRIFFPLSRVNE